MEIDLQEQVAYLLQNGRPSFGIAHIERTLRPPDQNRFVHDLGKGAQPLLEHVWEDC